MSSTAIQLRRLRERAGLSMEKLAKAAGFSHASGLQRYEDPKQRKRKYLPVEIAQKLVRALEGRGQPPITRAEVMALTGFEVERESRALQRRSSVQIVDARADMVVVSELDVRAAGGAGGQWLEVEAESEGDSIVGRYGFPTADFAGLYGAPPQRVRIITVVGDSMEPLLLPGQKVMVDIDDRRPSPPGVFVLWDGLGLVIKRIELMFGSEPARVRIKSANPAYESYERTLDEAHIMGRVLGRWQRL